MQGSYVHNRKCQIAFILIVLLWGEWLSYQLYSWLYWPSTGKGDIKMLLVADPQLIGYENENLLIGWLTRWDSDRYLSRGYQLAKDHSAPNSILFLGDLFDEGVECTETQFNKTMERFKAIFIKESSSVGRFYIAGDNDIGGEMEPVMQHLKDRFTKYFPNILPTRWKDITVEEINFFEYPAKIRTLFHSVNNAKLKILLTHAPISSGISIQAKPLNLFPPDLILSAHEHSALQHLTNRKDGSVRSLELNPSTSQVFGVLGKNISITELQTPTCSYRMGTTTIGYGVVTLTRISTTEFTYTFTILFLPSRFSQLILYGVCFFLIFIVSLLFRIPKRTVRLILPR